jgi:hypothetical protein
VVSEDEDEVEEDDLEEQQEEDLTHAVDGSSSDQRLDAQGQPTADGDDPTASATDATSRMPTASAESIEPVESAESRFFGSTTDVNIPTIDRMRRWMLADSARSFFIGSSVEQTIRTGISSSVGASISPYHSEGDRPPHVVCVGGGSGLCARAAMLSSDAQAGKISVIDVEWTVEHAAAVRDALSSLSASSSTYGNQQRSQCSLQVFDGAANLKQTLHQVLDTTAAADAAKEQVAVVVAEPYFVALSEGRTWAKGHALLWWWSVHTVHQIAPSAQVWPKLGRMRGMLVGFKRLWAATRPVSHPRAAAEDKRTAVFDISAFGERGELAQLCAHGRAAPIWQHEHAVCSQPFDLLEMDFASEPPQTLSTPPEGAATYASTSAGSPQLDHCEVCVCTCNALVVWIDYAHADGGWPEELSTGPDIRNGGPTPWSQGIRFLETPFDLSYADQGHNQSIIARVHARLDTLSGGLKLDVMPTTAKGCR